MAACYGDDEPRGVREALMPMVGFDRSPNPQGHFMVR